MNRLLQWTFLYDQEPFEVFSIFLKSLFGVLFFTKSQADIDMNPVLQLMNNLAPLWLWGTLTLVIAIFHIFTMLHRNWRLRKTAVMIAVIYWLFFFFLYLLNTHSTVATTVFPVLALFMGWVFVRVAIIERAQERKDNGSIVSRSR